MRACKKGVLAIGEQRSSGGYLMPYAQNPDACIACKMCASVPALDVCIEVTKE